jgi:ATP-binding cassette subfamily F protein 3
MIRADAVYFKRGEQTIFENMSFVVHAGQRVGIVGRNGVGKSTLFEMICRRIEPDDGDVDVPEGWRISHMRQELGSSNRPALDFVLDGHGELRRLEAEITRADRMGAPGETLAELHGRYDDLGGHEAQARAATILHGLGFASNAFSKPFDTFSGGWRIRLGLAQSLMRPAELLLLDEPTNHLDLEATVWLEQYLARHEGTILVIAHDRRFLDTVTDHTLHLIQGTAQVYRGGYSQFERTRAEALERESKTAAKRAAEIDHIQSFVQRFRAKASKARQVQSRLKVLERLKDVAPMLVDSPYRARFEDPDKVSNPLISFRDLSLGYQGKAVLTGLSQSIAPGARIGVLGVNGAGKSTLLKCLVGNLAPLDGELTRGPHSDVAYFSQHQMETLTADQTPLQHILAAQDMSEQSARDLLGGWGFDGNLVTRPVRTLSGGEKARLVLALIARTRPALLVLDEPTNHLDIDMREALSLALQTYAGAVVLVAHDRELLDATCDELWLLRDGQLHRFRDSVDAYTRMQQAEHREASNTGSAGSKKADRQARAELRRRQADARKHLNSAEQTMNALASQLEEAEAQLANPDTFATLPPEELSARLAQAGKLRRELEAAEEAWLAAAEALEAADD